jgi:hypothetical protein
MKHPTERLLIMSFKVTPKVRRLIELLAAQRTIDSGKRYNLTDIVEEAVLEKAKRERIKA